MDPIPVSYNCFNEMSPEMDLLAASSIGDLGLVHRLLQQGAHVDQPNESGWTPLMYAAHYGHYNVVKMLIDYGANVNIAEKGQGRTPLMLAASCGHTRCLEVLITLGAADIDMTDSQGHNAAYYAIHSGHGRNKIIAKLLKIQGKSRSSNSGNSNSTSVPVTSSSSAPISSGGGGGGGGGSRIRPLTKSRPEITSSGNSHGNHHSNPPNINGKHTSRGQGPNGGTISSSKISSTTKPEIFISHDLKGPIAEDSSPFPHGNGNSKMNDDSGNCAYYSPYLSLSRDGSPVGGQFTPSSHYISPSNGITSPFNVNNGLTPQITFDRLLGKRRLPMGSQTDRYSGQPNQKSFRRDQVTSCLPTSSTSSSTSTSSSDAIYNLLASANCSSQHQQQIQQHQSNLTSSSSPSPMTTTAPRTLLTTSITEESSSNEMNNLIDDTRGLNSAYSLNHSRKSSPGVIGSQLKGRSPSNMDRGLSTVSPNCSSEGLSLTTYDSRGDSGLSSSGEPTSSIGTCGSSSPSAGNQSSGDELSLPTILSDASSSSTNSISCSSYDTVLNRSQSPLPENLETLLTRIGLSQYIPLFSSYGIDLYCFLTLNESDLEEIGITLLGHRRKLNLAQLRFRESVEIVSTQERFFADWLLSERENLKKENHELRMKLNTVKSVDPPRQSITN